MSASGGTITDPGTGTTVTLPAGSMVPASQAKLEAWSGQRTTAQRTGFNTSLQAFDLTLTPSQFVGQNTVTVKLPWQKGADPIATMVVAFGANGRSLVLRSAPGSTPDSPSALLGSGELQFLVAASSMPSTPVTIQLGVAEQQVLTKAVSRAPTMVQIWSSPQTRTSYAGKKRVAVVVHGILNNSSDVKALKDFVSGTFRTEGATGTSYAFDEVYAFDYDWTRKIEDSGSQLAAKINNNWGNPDKFEVHIFAHSMGGLVSRVAIEKVGTPSVTQLVTLGTPHRGVPLTVVLNIAWATPSVPLAFNMFMPGVRELVDDSDLIASLNGSVKKKVQYQAIAGTSFNNFKYGIGDVIELVYTILHGHHIDHDGIVPANESALLGPASIYTSVEYNHSELVDNVSDYWPKVASSWFAGMNRKTATVEIAPTEVSVGVGATQPLTAHIFDKDHDKINPDLLSPIWKPSFLWLSDNNLVATVDSRTGLITGKALGTARVTVKDMTSDITSKPVTVTVGNVSIVGKILIFMTSTGAAESSLNIEGYGTIDLRHAQHKYIQLEHGKTYQFTWSLPPRPPSNEPNQSVSLFIGYVIATAPGSEEYRILSRSELPASTGGVVTGSFTVPE